MITPPTDPTVPAVTSDELLMGWEIMRGAASGKLTTRNPEELQFQGDTGETLKVSDNPMARIMMAWIEHLPKETVPQIGARIIALTTLLAKLPPNLQWGVRRIPSLTGEELSGSVHTAFLRAAAYSQLFKANKGFDPVTFAVDAEAEYRVLGLLQ